MHLQTISKYGFEIPLRLIELTKKNQVQVTTQGNTLPELDCSMVDVVQIQMVLQLASKVPFFNTRDQQVTNQNHTRSTSYCLGRSECSNS